MMAGSERRKHMHLTQQGAPIPNPPLKGHQKRASPDTVHSFADDTQLTGPTACTD